MSGTGKRAQVDSSKLVTRDETEVVVGGTEDILGEFVESQDSEDVNAPGSGAKHPQQNVIILRSGNEESAVVSSENPKGSYVLRGNQVVRVAAPTSGRLSSGSRGSPLKVQVIGGPANIKPGTSAQVPLVQRISSGPSGSFKSIVAPGATAQGGTILVKGQSPSGGAGRGMGSGQKVQYYRVMQTGDGGAPVQATTYRTLPSSTTLASQPIKALPTPSYNVPSGNESQVYSFPQRQPGNQYAEAPAPAFKRKSVVSGLKKPCNCTKSMCLKLYCDCFANGEFCRNCNCKDCHNNLVHDSERTKAIKSCLDRNPNAFQPKIGKGKGRSEVDRIHQKGCHCKKSSCLKNYCECYEAKVPCTHKCKCVGCRNTEHDRQSKGGSTAAKLMGGSNSGLLNLASAAATADLRPDSPLTDTSSEKPDPKSMPWFYMTDEVVECTTLCMVAQAEELENRDGIEELDIEKAILKEFGRCLHQIIENATVSTGTS